jgi:hypothetical protein
MISTTNIKPAGSGVSKTLQPGEHTLSITSVTLSTVPYKVGGYVITLNGVGPDLGSDFEGFFINKDDQGAGRYAGQVGQIRMSQYAFADGITKSGIEIKRDAEMLRALSNICTAFNCAEWLTTQDNKHDTIEELFAQFNSDKPFAENTARICIAGKEYENKAGYMNYELFIPKVSKGTVAMESTTVSEDKSRLMEFNPAVHLILKKSETVQEISPQDGQTTTGNDFDL